MEDFSKTSVTKNHKNSFDKMISSIAIELEKIKTEYYKIWTKVNEERKILAYCVEECIKLTKKAGIKTTKTLDQFDRLELVDFILENSYKYEKDDRDSIIELAKTIKEKYLTIRVESPKLLELEEKLSRYHVDENDYDDEVEIDLTLYKKTPPKEEIEDEELIALVNEAVNLKQDKEEYIIIDIKNDMSLIELSSKFYENPDYWIYIYDYRDNKQKIDDICEEKGITLDEFAYKKGVLTGISLKFPEEIKTIIAIQNGEVSRVY